MVKMLRALRKECNLTMRELGGIIGVSESAVSQYETGKRDPDYDTIQKLSDFFDVSVDYLLGRTASKKEGHTAQDGVSSENAILLDSILKTAGIDIKTMSDEERQRAAAILKAAFQK